jgi:hypothetical protein
MGHVKLMRCVGGVIIVGLSFFMTGCFEEPTDYGPDLRSLQSIVDSLSNQMDSLGQPSGYVGATMCAVCHTSEYALWSNHGHAFHLTKVNGAAPTYPFTQISNPPSGYTWDDISYVIGGFNTKAYFLDKDGYRIPGNSAYYFADGAYHSSGSTTKSAYTCGACHTTGWIPAMGADTANPAKHQDSLPGFYGTYKFTGIQCEACHGPGEDHIRSGGNTTLIDVDARKELCASCHGGGTALAVKKDGSNLYIRAHAPAELANTKHNALQCVTCHDPHKDVIHDTTGHANKVACQNCHFDREESFKRGASKMYAAGVECIDCHMPEAAFASEAESKYKADARVHLVRINTDASATQFAVDGKSANPYLTVEFSCLSCHADSTSTDPRAAKAWANTKIALPTIRDSASLRAWALQFAKSIHRGDNSVPVSYAGKQACATCHYKEKAAWDSTNHAQNFRLSGISTTSTVDTGSTYKAYKAAYQMTFINQNLRNQITGTGAGCAPCHVTGYNDPTGWNDPAKGTTHADSLRLESIQCEACHGPSSQHAYDGVVKYASTDVDYQARCERCHVSSYDEIGLVPMNLPMDSATLSAKSANSYLHHPQALFLEGRGLFAYPGQTFTNSAHKTSVQNGCVKCHLYPGTGHNLKTDVEACQSCHTDFAQTTTVVGADTLEFDYRNKQDTIAMYIEKLDELLSVRAFDSATTATDSTAVKAQFRYKAAYWNLHSIEADKSEGIHNYPMIKKALVDAIKDSANYLP